MKKRVGILYKTPVVEGDANLVTENEILVQKKTDESITLSKRDASGNMASMTPESGGTQATYIDIKALSSDMVNFIMGELLLLISSEVAYINTGGENFIGSSIYMISQSGGTVNPDLFNTLMMKIPYQSLCVSSVKIENGSIYDLLNALQGSNPTITAIVNALKEAEITEEQYNEVVSNIMNT